MLIEPLSLVTFSPPKLNVCVMPTRLLAGSRHWILAWELKAGRLLLQELRASIAKPQTFALERRLSGMTYVRLLRRARDPGYEIELHFLWLARPEQAIARLRQRVREGGH